MSRIFSFVYGIACYGMFLAAFLYLVAFVNDVGVAKTVSSGVPGDSVASALIDLALLGLFGLQHSIMARRGFKLRLAQFLPEAVERSTYVLATNLVLIVLFVFWRPLPGRIWQVGNPMLAQGIHVLCAMGWLLVLLSTFLTNHFDLFGLRQVYLNLVRKTYTPVGFREILFYRWIRHPMMLGVLIAFWASPLMTTSHFLFSLGMSVYVLIGIHFEEKGLRAELGEAYSDYVARTSRLLPFY